MKKQPRQPLSYAEQRRLKFRREEYYVEKDGCWIRNPAKVRVDKAIDFESDTVTPKRFESLDAAVEYEEQLIREKIPGRNNWESRDFEETVIDQHRRKAQGALDNIVEKRQKISYAQPPENSPPRPRPSIIASSPALTPGAKSNACSSDFGSGERQVIADSMMSPCPRMDECMQRSGELVLNGGRLELTMGGSQLWAADATLQSLAVTECLQALRQHTNSVLLKDGILGMLMKLTKLIFSAQAAGGVCAELKHVLDRERFDHILVMAPVLEGIVISNILLTGCGNDSACMPLAQYVPLSIDVPSLSNQVKLKHVYLKGLVLVMGERANTSQGLVLESNLCKTFGDRILVIKSGLEFSTALQEKKLTERLVIFAAVAGCDHGEHLIHFRDRHFSSASMHLPHFDMCLCGSLVLSIMCQSTQPASGWLSSWMIEAGSVAVVQAIGLVNVSDGFKYLRAIFRSFGNDTRISEACRQARERLDSSTTISKEGSYVNFIPIMSEDIRISLAQTALPSDA